MNMAVPKSSIIARLLFGKSDVSESYSIRSEGSRKHKSSDFILGGVINVLGKRNKRTF